MKQRTLSKKEIKEINETASKSFGKDSIFDKKDSVSIVDDKFVIKDGEVVLFYENNELIPSLRTLLKEQFLKEIVVDMGAVKFVTNGADIMRPGIVEISDGINQGDFVCIVDITHKKPLSVGVALFCSEDMSQMKSGKSIKNIHYIGDDVWNAFK